MSLLETERLSVRRLTPEDAAFILQILNEPAFILNVADRGIRTVDGARQYVIDGPLKSYDTFGFGLYAVELKETHELIGVCGLLKRDYLEHPDIGYSFLQKFWSRGYAREAAAAVLEYGRAVLGLKTILALTSLENVSSIRVLEAIGLKFDKIVQFPGHAAQSRLFTTT